MINNFRSSILCCFTFVLICWSYTFAEELCNSETFKPICKTNEKLIIKEAYYGRKKFGKCITEEGENIEVLSKISGYINCYTDVRHILEPQCAGKQSCEIIVSKINAKTNCNKAFKLYLEVDHGCMKELLIKFVACEEFCNSELFKPACSQNKFIIINKAHYGRKSIGKCIRKDEIDEDFMKKPGYINCYSDVKHGIELQCAGKQRCEISVARLGAVKDCNDAFKFYLEAEYSCVKVVPDGGQCSVSVAKERQHVSSIRTKSDSCGREDRPWKVDSMVGQRINVTFIQLIASNKTQNRDGYLYFSTSSEDYVSSCHFYAKIIDRKNRAVAALCYEKDVSITRNRHYLSGSNEVEIVYNKERPADSLQFLLSFDATGCSDLIAPADAWIKRHDNKATVGCYTTRLRWHLECQGSRWIGVIGNCSYAHKEEILFSEIKTKPKSKMNDHDQMVTVFGIIVGGIILCLLIACVGIVLLKRYYALSKLRSLKNLTYNGNIQPMYNNLNNSKTPIYFDKSNFNDESAYFPPEEAQQDNTHYFELDQALVNKQPPST